MTWGEYTAFLRESLFSGLFKEKNDDIMCFVDGKYQEMGARETHERDGGEEGEEGEEGVSLNDHNLLIVTSRRSRTRARAFFFFVKPLGATIQ